MEIKGTFIDTISEIYKPRHVVFLKEADNAFGACVLELSKRTVILSSIKGEG